MADAQPKPAAELATTIQTDSVVASSPSKLVDSVPIEQVKPVQLTEPIENNADLVTTDSTIKNDLMLNDKHEDVIMNDDSIDKGNEESKTQCMEPEIVNSKPEEEQNNVAIVENEQAPKTTSVPNIIINHGPAPKRNVAVKNTSAGINRHQNLINNSGNNINKLKKQQAVRYGLSDDDNVLTDKEDTSFEYNSNDEYIPKNVGSDGSDMEFDSSTKRKSARLSKKPKILDEYVIDSSQDSINSKQLPPPPPQSNQLQELDNLPTSLTNRIQQATKEKSSELLQQAQSRLQTTMSNSNPKQFARKSTAPIALSNLNQNISLNQQQKKLTNKISSQSQYTSNATPVTTLVANNQNSLKQQGLTQVLNGSHSSALTKANSKTPVVGGAVSTASQSQQQQITPTVKQFRNKIISCKPFCESKATECMPVVKDASTQIDLDEIKLTHTVVPIPVPLHVPLPMCMYQAPMPVPILIPVPIPVPVFIPTTKKTYDRIQRRVQKLRKKLPSDPYEFEILLYAEKLAREEGIPGFEDSSDGESEPETSKPKHNVQQQDNNALLQQQQQQQQQDQQQKNFMQNDSTQMSSQMQASDQEGSFKWVYGVNLFNTWFGNKITQLKQNTTTQRLPDDLLKLKNDELNLLLADFVHEIRKPSGEIYAPESVYYLCLGIQHYLQEKGRVENIFLDNQLFDKFQESLNEIAIRYQIRINPEGHITSRIEEEILWESKQLGAYSPFVLLNTILYFNTKYFFLDKPESHLQLSFSNVKKHSKRNIGPNGEDYGKTSFLRYYPDFHGLEQVIYEQGENYDNPLRCPVELYNFYLSKCPESVKNRNDVFYLVPEKASLPSSPVWFSSQPLSVKMLERMVNRIKMVKEVNELLLAASPMY